VRETLAVNHAVNAYSSLDAEDIKANWYGSSTQLPERLRWRLRLLQRSMPAAMWPFPFGRRVAVLHDGSIEVFELPELPAAPVAAESRLRTEPHPAANPPHTRVNCAMGDFTCPPPSSTTQLRRLPTAAANAHPTKMRSVLCRARDLPRRDGMGGAGSRGSRQLPRSRRNAPPAQQPRRSRQWSLANAAVGRGRHLHNNEAISPAPSATTSSTAWENPGRPVGGRAPRMGTQRRRQPLLPYAQPQP